MTILKKGTSKDILFVVWAGLATLFTYSLVYALRKPFSAATFAEMEVWGVNFKIMVAIAQIIGYLIAKFAGIKLLAELKKTHRLKFIVVFGVSAQISLFLFALIPYPYNFSAMFLNGLSLGCMWGVVFSFIEGRKTTDLLASILGVSIVISSGLAKSVGLFFLNTLNVSPFWMPASIGAIALPLLILMGWILTRLPEPSASDIELKQERLPLDGKQRKALFRQFAFSLVCILSANFLVTVLRDIKEDFLVDIMAAAGNKVDTWLFTHIDSAVTLIILVIFGLMVLVKNNIRVIQILLSLVLVGSVVLTLSSYYYSQLALSPAVWLFVQSISIYVVYLTFQTIFFDRFIAAFMVKGNVVFFIALVDAIGYLGTCIMLFVKEFSGINLNWLQFYNLTAIIVGLFSFAAFTLTLINLTSKYYKLKNNKKCQKSVVSSWIGQEPQWITDASPQCTLSSACSVTKELK